ncbi:MAG: transporter [Nitrospirae bacterium]|nr:transporter [Nitrospirota bacterium]
MFKKTIVVLLWSGLAFAAHPLITDDTGTQGKGKCQLELNGEYGHENENGIVESTTNIATALTYGIVDNIDVVLGIPYQYIRIRDSESTARHDGISDVSIDLKWRFYEKDGLSFALKPGITLPTGDDERGLGAGRTTYGLYFITTREMKPWAFHLNLGYRRNENKLNQRKDIWHASLAGETGVAKDLKAVVNIGVERNPGEETTTHPAFILGGFIYSLNEQLDIDAGVKAGLNKAETDYSLLAGLTYRF